MSDPVTNAEIEDVLSSIRRLVSEDPSSFDRRPQRQRPVEKLVLTQALRVSEPVEPAAEDDADFDLSDLGDTDETAEATDPPLRLDAAFAAPETHQAEDEGADGATEDTASLDDRQDGEQAEDAGNPAEAAFWSRLDAAEAEDRTSHEAQTPEDAAEDDTDALIASLGLDETEESEAQPDVAEEDHSSFAETGDETASIAALYRDEEQGAPHGQPEAASDESAVEREDPPSEPLAMAEQAPRAPRTLTLEERIAELEAAISRTAGEWEPDGSEEAEAPQKPFVLEAIGGETPDDAPAPLRASGSAYDIDSLADTLWGDTPTAAEETSGDEEPSRDAAADDTAEPEMRQADEPEARHDEDQAAHDDDSPSSDMTAAADSDGTDDTGQDEGEDTGAASTAVSRARADGDALGEVQTLDEEMLSRLVADIVRQELQGVLGERITRNVKRLVRREVQRALAMKNLD